PRSPAPRGAWTSALAPCSSPLRTSSSMSGACAADKGWILSDSVLRSIHHLSRFSIPTSRCGMHASASLITFGAPGLEYSGTLYRTTGPALNAQPFDPTAVERTAVGAATFTFSDGDNASFAYTVNGVSQMKAITGRCFRAQVRCVSSDVCPLSR